MCLHLHTSKHILGSDVFSLYTSVPKKERFISITSTGWKKLEEIWILRKFQISLCLANGRLL